MALSDVAAGRDLARDLFAVVERRPLLAVEREVDLPVLHVVTGRAPHGQHRRALRLGEVGDRPPRAGARLAAGGRGAAPEQHGPHDGSVGERHDPCKL